MARGWSSAAAMAASMAASTSGSASSMRSAMGSARSSLLADGRSAAAASGSDPVASAATDADADAADPGSAVSSISMGSMESADGTETAAACSEAVCGADASDCGAASGAGASWDLLFHSGMAWSVPGMMGITLPSGA